MRFADKPLLKAIEQGNIEKAKQALANKASPNAYLDDGRPILTACLDYNRPDIAELMLQCGAKASAKGKIGGNPLLLLAVMESNPEIVELLLRHGASVKQTNNAKVKPILQASFQDDTDLRVLDLLLKHGADVNERGSGDWTPLMFAVALKKLDLVQFLLDHGANPHLRDKVEQKTALDMAMQSDHPDAEQVAKLIKDHLVKLEQKALDEAANIKASTPDITSL